MSLVAAALQLGPASATIEAMVDRILKLVEAAGSAGVKLAVLPELSLTPYFAAAVHSDLDPFAAETSNQQAVKAIAAAAGSHGMAIVIPFAERNGNQLYNSMAFADVGGALVGTFRKMHIPGQAEPKADGAFTIMEKRYFAPGDLGFQSFDVGAASVGGLICYDRRFPESYRSLANRGAEVICVGYNTPVMPNTPGATLAAARRASELAMCGGAYSTATYVIAAGKAGIEGGVRFIGGSLIAGPDGTILKRARSAGDELVVAELDLDRQRSMRERWAFATNQRSADYVMTASA